MLPGRISDTLIAAAAAIAIVIGGVGFWQFKRRAAPVVRSVSPTTVAVLPFQNLSSDKESDFLRLALADEIATTLSYARSLSIRPFATTNKYTSPSLDLEQAGREMRVTDIVTGHFLKEGNQLQVTLEAIDVANNRAVWRDTLNVAAADLIAMRGQITAKVRQGLVPALGAGTESENGTRPKNEEAYDLYLRSVSIPHDASPNKEAIAMLERAVGLDPNYAPAWRALGERYYYDGHYSDGGEAMLQRSMTAEERALALDPNFSDAAGQLISSRVETGELGKAYRDAKALVDRHPENAMAHFALSYVLRYAGVLDESARECDAALALDPGAYQLRSCSFTFDLLGNPDRAMDFLQLDMGSEWVASNLPPHFLRQGKIAEARESARKLDVQQSESGLQHIHKSVLGRWLRRSNWTRLRSHLCWRILIRRTSIGLARLRPIADKKNLRFNSSGSRLKNTTAAIRHSRRTHWWRHSVERVNSHNCSPRRKRAGKTSSRNALKRNTDFGASAPGWSNFPIEPVHPPRALLALDSR